jgi:hypothetical protein
MNATAKRLHGVYATFTVRAQVFVEPGQDVDEAIARAARGMEVSFNGDEKAVVIEVEGQEGCNGFSR